MKKVLIITHLLHASPRIPGLAKYLQECGWQPIILTPFVGRERDSWLGPLDDFAKGFRVIETCYYDALGVLRRLSGLESSEPIDRFTIRKQLGITSEKSPADFFLKLGGAIICYPDGEKGWRKHAIRATSELLENENIDAMISSSPPVTSHLIAKELRDQYKIPWVAELRDLWSQNANYSYGSIRNLVDRRLELKTLAAADGLVTLCQVAARSLARLHRREVHTITNGFDPEKIGDEKVVLTPNFTITYTGQIYPHKQDPSKLLAALRDLISCGTIDSKDIVVRFYGPMNRLLLKEVEGYGLSAVVRQYGIIPREISFEKQRESQLLLLLNWEDPREKSVFTLKIFEYLAARRPVLATGGFGDDAIESLLGETGSGTYCSTIEEIKNALEESYSEYKLKGRVAYSGHTQEISKYSYREMARKFAEILDNLTRRENLGKL